MTQETETFGQYILTYPDNGTYEFDDADDAIRSCAEAQGWEVEISHETRDTGFGTERKYYFTIPITDDEHAQDEVEEARRIISEIQIV